MAKTRKGSRKAASAKARKKAKKPARPVRRTKGAGAGGGKRVDLNPIKRNLRAHMDQLAQIDDPRVREALAGLESVQRELTASCAPTMVIGG